MIDTLEGQPLSVSFASPDLQQIVLHRRPDVYRFIGCYLRIRCAPAAF